VRLRLALIVLAAPLALAGSANAALPSGNVIVNGDAEAGPGATNSTDAPVPPGWQVIPSFTAVVYGTGGFPSAADGAAIGGGANFFAGGPDAGLGDTSAATQQIDLTDSAAELDGTGVTATLTADLGGYAAQGDSAAVVAVFGDATGGGPGNGFLTLPQVTAEDRGNVTGFVRRTACTALQPGARRAYVQVIAQRNGGQYNDGYADNISLTLSTTPCPPVPDAPLTAPVPPQAGVSANADVVKGRVFVKKPGSNTYQELRDARSIPVGSEVDTERGEVELQTAADSSGAVQLGKFRDAKFVMTQTPGRRPITDLTLMAGRIDKCPAVGQQAGAAARKPGRRLWGDARGRFRTRGRFATATVRGTQWMVKDTCTATTVQVSRGSVTVRDLVKRRNIRLKAPRRYTARARRG
jgi:hypothetical protein